MTEDLVIHLWTTLVCNACKTGFQIESINNLGDQSKVTCPFCQSQDVRTYEPAHRTGDWYKPRPKWLPIVQFPSGEGYILDRRMNTEDLDEISKMWNSVRVEEIQRIETDGKEKILQYLRDKGYVLSCQERIRFT